MKPFNRYIVTYYSEVFCKLTVITMYAQSGAIAYSICRTLGMERIQVRDDKFLYAPNYNRN